MSSQLNTQRLKECREKAGLSKRETSKRINVSQPAYVRYENGTRSPSIQVITSMASVLNTSVAYLVGESDQNEPDFIYVNKDSSPELFSIIESCQSYDDNKLKLLKEFCDSLL